MKLTDPTDETLNAAFAEKVAGWRGPAHPDTLAACDEGMKKAQCWWLTPEGKLFSPGFGVEVPAFTTSADAVLPCLEKAAGGHWSSWYSHPLHSDMPESYEVSVLNAQSPKVAARAETFAKAAVIALLRANGVEITFTK